MKNAVQALRMFLVMTFVLGIGYPLAVTIIGQGLFSQKAGGSLIEKNGKVIGSSLLAQKFESPRYFKSRPSAVDYNPLPSGGTNLGPTSKKLIESADANRVKFGATAPKDLIFASGSGLDPHISPAAAKFQIEQIAIARGFDDTKKAKLAKLVESKVEGRQLGFLGEERVNVLELNLAVDLL